jgi:hypothetical protein
MDARSLRRLLRPHRIMLVCARYVILSTSSSSYSLFRRSPFQTQWDIAGLYFYFAQTLSVKLSILAFYHRIFGISSTACRIWIYILASAQTILFIAFCIFQGLQCVPLQRYFDLSVPGRCKDEGTVILGGELPNSIIDFAMVILAMIMIRPLQLSFSDKLRITVLFGLGFMWVASLLFIAVSCSPSNSFP